MKKHSLQIVMSRVAIEHGRDRLVPRRNDIVRADVQTPIFVGPGHRFERAEEVQALTTVPDRKQQTVETEVLLERGDTVIIGGG